MPRVRLEIPLSLPVTVCGPKASRDLEALIDTGATYMVISWEDAIRLGYEPWRAPTVQVGPAGGIMDAPLLKVDSVGLLGLRRTKVETIVKDLTDVGIAAVVGWSFLRYFRMTFDPEAMTFEITELSA